MWAWLLTIAVIPVALILYVLATVALSPQMREAAKRREIAATERHRNP